MERGRRTVSHVVLIEALSPGHYHEYHINIFVYDDVVSMCVQGSELCISF